MSFFDELKRRNVFRIALAYGITAWLIAQIAGLAADSFGAPDWVMKMVITMLVLGAPVAMVMAWAYELTPEGLRRESDIAPGQSRAKANASKLDRTITIALVMAVAYIAYDKLVLDPRRDAELLEGTAVQATQNEEQAEPAVEGSVPAEESPSIAVLPFVNMSDDAGNEYFSEGLSEELLNLLVRIPELKVAARTSSFSYKGKDVKIAQIGEELNVAHVLEGSVRKSGDQVRITAQLIKADDGFHLWSETYDRTLEDIFVIQDDIAAAVVDALKVTLLGELPEIRETDPEVYALYLQAKHLTNLAGKDNLVKAVAAYRQALDIDPEYVPAWVGKSVAYTLLTRLREYDWDEGAMLAFEATNNALELDPGYAFAWASLAYLKRTFKWDWDGAKEAVEKALALDPDNLEVFGTAASLAITFGQPEKAAEFFEKILEQDPLNLLALDSLGGRYRHMNRLDEALEIASRVQKLNPDFPGIQYEIGRIYLKKGDLRAALRAFESGSIDRNTAGWSATAHAMLGEEEKAMALARRYLQIYADDNPVPMGVIWTTLGDHDQAFYWLERAYDQRYGSLVYILSNDGLVPLHDDPRWESFLEKMGLLEYWKAMPPEYGGPPEQGSE